MQKNLPFSYVELSKNNIIHNVKQFRTLVKKGTKIAGVIKANAYGHGDKEVVKILAPYVDYFQVNSVEELERVRKVTKKPILLLGYVGKNDLARAINLGCILAVFDFHHALLINETARKIGKNPAGPNGRTGKQKVHIAVDSHLGREGFLPGDLEKVLPEFQKMKHITIDGVYSHFANIEDTTDFSHAQKQIDIYEKVITMFRTYGYKNLQTHISATSGVLAYEKGSGSNHIVRVGLGLYGLWPSEALQKKYHGKITLRPAMRWVTHTAQIKLLPKGHSIGYGLTYITKKPTTIAVIPQGYSNGFSRVFSNNGEVLIRGVRAPILGRVAMNMFVVDVSHIEGVETEDEVVLLGTQGDIRITAEERAGKHTINYEITTGISPLLPRIVRE